MKIIIDAGHGGSDPGAVNGVHKEKDYALSVALKLGKLLSKAGVQVIYTRIADTFPTPKDRYDLANTSHADYFVSIHFNSAITPDAEGIETLCCATTGKANIIANAVQNALIGSLRTKNRGVRVRTNIAVLNYTKMPAILVEGGFLSNPTDLKKIASDGYQTELARAIFDGLADVLGLKLPENVELVTVNDIIYRLGLEKILTNKDYWNKRAIADKNIYYLLKNMANYTLEQ